MSEYPPPDPAALASLDAKRRVVCDFVAAVALLYKTAFFLWGTGGIGKSYTVLRRLEQLERPHRLYNSRMTAKGLFLALKDAPDATHVLEDMETLTRDAHAQGVLRSALWAQPGHDRRITWTTAANPEEPFTFRGGIVMVSNRPLDDLPELRALATRIETHRFEVTEAEVTALMWDLAARGLRAGETVLLGPDECQRVTAHLLTECRAAGCPLDLRLQQKAFQTFRQWDEDQADTHWEDLVRIGVREAAAHFRHQADARPPEERRRERRDVVREVRRLVPDVKQQERLYTERTGASRADFYRRKREVESGEFEPEVPPEPGV